MDNSVHVCAPAGAANSASSGALTATPTAVRSETRHAVLHSLQSISEDSRILAHQVAADLDVAAVAGALVRVVLAFGVAAVGRGLVLAVILAVCLLRRPVVSAADHLAAAVALQQAPASISLHAALAFHSRMHDSVQELWRVRVPSAEPHRLD